MARRSEVLIVTPGGLAQRGGMGRNMSYLVAAFAERPDPPRWRVIDSWCGEWRVRVSPHSPLCFARALLTILATRLSNRLALLHLRMAGGGSAVRKGIMTWLGWALGVPVIVHLAAFDIDAQFERLPGVGKALFRRTLQRARFVVVLGRYWQRFFVDVVGLDAERVIVIPNGVPDPGSPPVRPDRPPVRLLFLGRLGERKGTPEVLAALADPRLAPLDWRITFAGDGAVEAMRRRADELGLGERTAFPGWVERDEAQRLLAAADIFLLPSRHEGLPVALLEAMAHGLAIVTTQAGAIADAITDREDGLLVPPGDPAALADAVVELVAQPPLRRRLQRAARRRFERDYTVDVYAERFLDLYRACGLADRPAAGRGEEAPPQILRQ